MDHWEEEANMLDHSKEEEKQEAMNREVLRDIWIKTWKYSGVEDIMGQEANDTNLIDKYSETYRKNKAC